MYTRRVYAYYYYYNDVTIFCAAAICGGVGGGRETGLPRDGVRRKRRPEGARGFEGETKSVVE